MEEKETITKEDIEKLKEIIKTLDPNSEIFNLKNLDVIQEEKNIEQIDNNSTKKQ